MHSSIPQTHFRPALLAAFSFALAGFASGAALTVTPSTIPNDYNGVISLNVTALPSAGQQVVIEKFYDANASGSIDAGDPVMGTFKVQDGQIPSLAGRRNLNVPGDDDGLPNSAIITKFYLTPDEIPGRLDGRFIYRVSPAVSGFTAVTASLVITQKDYGGSRLTGRVMGSGVAQGGAIVLITTAAANDFDVVGITRSDAAGNYTLKVPAGTYRPVPAKSGFIFNVGAATMTTVTSGNSVAAPDAVLTPRGRTISGALKRAGSPGETLGAGLLVYGMSQSGLFSLTFTTGTGYILDATPGEWQVGTLEQEIARFGLLHTEGNPESSASNVIGFDLTYDPATALIYGQVRAPGNSPVPFIDINGKSEGAVDIKSYSFTDSNGNYTLAVAPGDWRIEAEPPGFIIPESNVAVSAAGSAVLHDLTASPVTAHLRGQARDNLNNPVSFVEIQAYDLEGAGTTILTDANGNFDLGVYGGPNGTTRRWTIQLNQGHDGEPADYISTSPEFVVTDGTDINGINYLAYRVTAHLRGSVLDETNAPIGFVNIYAFSQSGEIYSFAETQGDGSFDLPVFGGTWSVQLEQANSSGFLRQDDLSVTVADDASVEGLTYRVRHTTGTISGTVKNTQGNPLGFIDIVATINVGGIDFQSTDKTDASGFYSLPAFPGNWSVNADAGDLFGQNYQPTAAQHVNFTSGNLTVNFVATRVGGGPTFPSWQTQYFTPAESADPNVGGHNADPDHDGLTNLMEFALHLNPLAREATGQPFPGSLPGSPPFVTLTFTRLVGAQGLSYNVQQSSGLSQPWTPVAASFEVLSSDGVTETVRAKAPVGASGKMFLRLVVVLTGA